MNHLGKLCIVHRELVVRHYAFVRFPKDWTTADLSEAVSSQGLIEKSEQVFCPRFLTVSTDLMPLISLHHIPQI
jgi:hypothetical protein